MERHDSLHQLREGAATAESHAGPDRREGPACEEWPNINRAIRARELRLVGRTREPASQVRRPNSPSPVYGRPPPCTQEALPSTGERAPGRRGQEVRRACLLPAAAVQRRRLGVRAGFRKWRAWLGRNSAERAGGPGHLILGRSWRRWVAHRIRGRHARGLTPGSERLRLGLRALHRACRRAAWRRRAASAAAARRFGPPREGPGGLAAIPSISAHVALLETFDRRSWLVEDGRDAMAAAWAARRMMARSFVGLAWFASLAPVERTPAWGAHAPQAQDIASALSRARLREGSPRGRRASSTQLALLRAMVDRESGGNMSMPTAPPTPARRPPAPSHARQDERSSAPSAAPCNGRDWTLQAPGRGSHLEGGEPGQPRAHTPTSAARRLSSCSPGSRRFRSALRLSLD